MIAYYSLHPDNPRYVLHIRKGDSGETYCFTYMALDNPAHKKHMKRIVLTGWIMINAEVTGNKVMSSDGRWYRVCKKCLQTQARERK